MEKSLDRTHQVVVGTRREHRRDAEHADQLVDDRSRGRVEQRGVVDDEQCRRRELSDGSDQRSGRVVRPQPQISTMPRERRQGGVAQLGHPDDLEDSEPGIPLALSDAPSDGRLAHPGGPGEEHCSERPPREVMLHVIEQGWSVEDRPVHARQCSEHRAAREPESASR
nr:hypothetical protein [Nocardioides daeguensis]